MSTKLTVTLFLALVAAACASKASSTSAVSGASSGAGASTTAGATTGAVTTGATTGTTAATTGPGATATAGSSGAGGAAIGATTGSSASGSTGAGGSCATTPTFTQVLAGPLSGCSGFEPPCHNSGAGMLTIKPSNPNATWAQLVNQPTVMTGVGGVRVQPGDPLASFLYRKLTNDLGPNEGPPMPEPPSIHFGDGGWQELPAADIEMVRCWILGGALNN